MLKFIRSPQKPPISPLGRVISIVLGAFILLAIMALSLVFFSVFVCVLLVFWAYFWFKTRKVRELLKKTEEMRAQTARETAQDNQRMEEGLVIEGEAVRVDEKP